MSEMENEFEIGRLYYIRIVWCSLMRKRRKRRERMRGEKNQ